MLKPLPIVATAAFSLEAVEPARSLRDELKQACPAAPRRLNRLIELALIGAHRCAAGRAPGNGLDPGTAIYMACTHGTVADAASMVRDAVRGAPSMPVTFINTSSNMAGFYVASTLGLHSGNHVGSAAEFAFESTLELMRASGGPALFGAVEECAWPLDAHRVRLGLARGASVLETSQWLLADPAASAPRAWLEGVRYFGTTLALLDFLRHARPAPQTQVQVSGPSDVAALAQIGAALKLVPRTATVPAGYTGMPAALHCVEFVENGAPGSRLLHLSSGKAGAWYLLELRRA